MDIEDIEVGDYDYEDQSDVSEEASSVSSSEKSDEESDEDILEVPMKNTERKSSNIILREGANRTTLNKLDKFERCSAVIFYAKEIEKGAKVPEIVKPSLIEGVTDTISLAYISVMETVRKSSDEIRSKEDISRGASISIKRKIREGVYDIWKLHELVWYGKLEEEFSDYDLIESSSIKLDDWYNM